MRIGVDRANGQQDSIVTVILFKIGKNKMHTTTVVRLLRANTAGEQAIFSLTTSITLISYLNSLSHFATDSRDGSSRDTSSS